ncbi:hypothetical protein Tco_1359532 [Tanacetum coccineum]
MWQSQAPRNHGGTPGQTRSERVLEQPNEPPLSKGHTSGSGEGKMEQTFELTDNVPSTPHDLPLTGGYTPGSDEGRMKLDELITLCTKLLKWVLDLEKGKDAQAVEILNLKKREDASKQGRRSDKIKPMFTDKDFEELDDHMENVEEETLDVATTGVSTAALTISTVEPRTPPSSTIVFNDEDVTMAMAQTLIKMKEQKAKEKGVAITDVEDSSTTVRPVRSITTLQPLPTIDPKDKGKGVLVEEEPVKIKRKYQGDLQIQADAELAQRLHEEELSELEKRQKERVAQEDASMAALYEEYDTIQASIDADALDAEIRSKPPTMTQLRNLMITYLKNTGGYKYSQLKEKTYEEIYGLESKKKTLARKRAGEKKIEESAKKKKLEDVAEEQESAKSDEEAVADYEHEKEDLRMWLTVISDEEENVDPKILSAKYPIVDWESQNLGSVDMEDLYVYKIIRADGNTSYHKSLSSMLRKFNRQDLVDLHKLVMKRFEDTTPEGYNLLLWGDLKVMFESNAEDEIWSNQQDWTLISWKLYESCGVHTLLIDGTFTCFNMLVEKRTMDITRDQQIALDDALVAPANRIKIGKTDVPEIYMQEFWATATVHHHSIRFKMNNKKHIVNLEYFRYMLQICPKLPNQQFEELPFEEAILTFLRDLGHSGEIKMITDVNVNKLHQPWRSFAAVINKCLSGKSTGYDSLRLSQAQILWGMYHKKNVDYAYLLWEDFFYQVENKNVKRSNEMYYPRFTKVIVNFFMTKDQSIPRRNKVNWHFARDDYMFTTIKVVSRHEDTQLYGAILPDKLTNEAIKDSESYKEYYAIASVAEPPKTKASVKKKQVRSDMSKTPPTKGKRLNTSAKAAKTTKKKQPAKTSKAKGLTVLSEVALTEAEQMN